MAKKEDKTPKIEKIEKKEKAPKVVKEAKTVTAKKLPGLLKKSYSEAALEKKIYKKIFIEADKKMLAPLFKVDPKSEGKKVVKYKIPAETKITVTDLKRLKKLAKDIKTQKGRFKIVPFAAVVTLLAAIGICVTVFKNPIVKKAIVGVMEGAFGAKCDVAKVDIKIFGAKFEVAGIAQANKNDTMKNLFEIGKIDFDFNLTQLLRGRFVAENLEVSGVAIGTDRKTDGKLPPRKAKANSKKMKKEAEKNDEAGFFASLSEKSGSAAKASLSGLFDSINQYNPEAVLKEVQSKMQTPAVSKEVESKVSELVKTYQDMPKKIEGEISSFTKTAQELSNLKVSSSNPAEIASSIAKVKSAIEAGNKAKELVENSTKGLQTDAETVKNLSEKMAEAVKNDTALVKEKTDMYVNFSLDDATRIVTGAMDVYLLGVLGDYYPYLQKAINSVGAKKGDAKASSKDAKKEKKDKGKKDKKAVATKKQGRRLYGRDITWKRDKYPKFLIERIFASGPVFDAKIVDLSSDMDKWGKPAVATCNFSVGSTKHGADFTVDARKTSSAPLIAGGYEGSNISLKLDTSGGDESAQGVPTFDGVSKIKAKITADENFAFSIGGNLFMNPLKVSATAFENEKVNRLYQNALASISSMDLGFTIGFDQTNGIKLDLKSDIDKVVAKAVMGTLKGEVEGMKAQVSQKLQEELAKYTGGASDQISKFTNISGDLTKQRNSVDNINAQLSNKLSELLKAQTSSTLKANVPGVNLPSSSSSSSSQDNAKDSVNNLLKGFKR